MDEVVIVDAVRTPMWRFQWRVSQFTAPELGDAVIRALKERNDLKGEFKRAWGRPWLDRPRFAAGSR